MAITPEEQARVIEMLNNMSREQVKKVISSQQSFGQWLSTVLTDIYNKIKEVLSNIWNSLASIFS